MERERERERERKKERERERERERETTFSKRLDWMAGRPSSAQLERENFPLS